MLMSIVRTAYRFIRFDRAKSIGVMVGIVISTFLIGQQLGIAFFLSSLMSAVVDNSSGDIWVIDTRAKDANQVGFIDSRNTRLVQSIPGVAIAYPIVITGGKATFPDGSNTAISLIGSDAPLFKAGPMQKNIIEGSFDNLLNEGAVTADYYDRDNFGGSAAVGQSFEISGKRAYIAVQTKGVRGFGGTMMYTTIDRARYYGNVSDKSISAIVLNVKSGANADSVVTAINKTIYGVRAWKKGELSFSTVYTILFTSGIGVSTGSLIIFAIISGFFIIGLTMYSSALDRLKDYGTLKAIGANNRYIRALILGQAFSFAIIGFVIAYLLLLAFIKGSEPSGLVIHFPIWVLAALFMVTLLISLSGAIFALRRIKGVEPASVFR